MHFSDLQLHPTILAAVEKEGYTTPTPIQQQAIPHVLAGKDLVALAQTGTGKTAAFALPLLHRLAADRPAADRAAAPAPKRPIRVLVLAPTRELASQIGDGFAGYGGRALGLVHTVIFGGVGKEPQMRALRQGVDVLIATPGRLLDLMNDRVVDFRNLSVLVLDEADRMLDMGFIYDVKKIIAAVPKQRQTLLFSATMPQDIEELARQILQNPVRVAVAPPATTVDRIDQSVFFVEQKQKRALLLHLLKGPEVKRAIVFTRTKHGANRVAEFLDGSVGAAAIHGNKSQGARERALEGFKRGQLKVLVATDIAARGIDIDEVSHVIQMDLPEVPEQYVHRIGRTARAGADGIAWAFCAMDERSLLRDIERAIRKKIDIAEHPFLSTAVDPSEGRETERYDAREPRTGQRRGGRPAQSGSGQGGRAQGGRGQGGRGGPGARGGPGHGGQAPRGQVSGEPARRDGGPVRPASPAAGASAGQARSNTRSFGPGRR